MSKNFEVELVAAVTADGFIARSADHRSTEWTSKEDTSFFVSRIKHTGAMVMGRTTFETVSRFPKNLQVAVLTSRPDEFTNPKPKVIDAWGTKASPQDIVAEFKRRGAAGLVVAGGSSVYTQFMQAGVVDRLFLTIEPVLFGQGINLFSEELNVQLQLYKRHTLSDQTTVLEFEVDSSSKAGK